MNSGSAYIFFRTLLTWGDEVILVALDVAAGDIFGRNVAISGDYAIVGALGKASSTGAAYIFLRDVANWDEREKIVASDGATGDQFGFSVSISGNYAIVGAYDNDDVPSNSGSAYVYNNIITYTATTSKTYIANANMDFTLVLPATPGLEYLILNALPNEITLSGSIFPGNPTTVASGGTASAYNYNTQWLVS